MSTATSTILIADDDAFYRKRVGSLLASTDVDFELCSNGNQAVVSVLANPRHYSCIVLDLHMAETDGIEAIQMIRRVNSEVPVVLMTADDTLDAERQARTAGVFYLLIKPFGDEEFLEVLNGAIGIGARKYTQSGPQDTS